MDAAGTGRAERRPPKDETLEDQQQPTNDPRPLGGVSEEMYEHRQGQKTEDEQPTNDPRPLGGSTENEPSEDEECAAKLQGNQQANWKDPIDEAENAAASAPEAPGALLSNAKDAATDALRTAHAKAVTVASSAKESATEALEAGKQKMKTLVWWENNNEGQQSSKADEVDASPEEQFTRHHVELNPEKFHSHYHPHHPGTLERAKEKIKERLFHHTTENEEKISFPPSSLVSGEGGGAVTLDGLKVRDASKVEPVHMANGAEGRNSIVENKNAARKNKLTMSSTSAGGAVGTGDSNNDFPETLQDAIHGAQVSQDVRSSGSGGGGVKGFEKAKEEYKSTNEDVVPQGGDVGNEPEPFGITSGARSKL